MNNVYIYNKFRALQQEIKVILVTWFYYG